LWRKREALKSWTILLAILAFGFSLIGTFIVRSGVLTSVHAFANDPERGVFILLILAFFMGGALLLFALRAGAMEAKGVFSTVSRESGLVVNNLLLAVSTFVVFIGTIWPLIAEMFFDRTLSVGPPFFDAAFTPFVFAAAVVLPIGAMLPWKRATLGRPIRALIPAMVLALACGLLAWTMFTGHSAIAPIGVALSVWLVAGAAVDIWSRTGRGGIGQRLGRLTRLPRADWGKTIAHAGLGITMFGVVTLTGYEVEDIRVAQVGAPYTVGAYQIELVGVDENVRGPNYISTIASITVREAESGRLVSQMHPERRIYPVAGMPTTEAGINNGFTRDVYVTLGDPQENGGWAVRTWIKPFANWIWGGTIIMAIGGLLQPVGPPLPRGRGRGQGAQHPQGRPGGMRDISWPFSCARLAFPAVAVQPDEVLPDPVLEERARDISAGLRCIVCRNESIDESNAELARDLRLLVRERLVAGDSDEAVVAYIVDRYGEYVLLRPPMTGSTVALWLAAPVLMLLGLGLSVAYVRRRSSAVAPTEADLSEEEAARLKEILND
jgi:cytochrome c biogenesis factor/cytochrome c-type biogenesis protein CcmH/NrfF